MIIRSLEPEDFELMGKPYEPLYSPVVPEECFKGVGLTAWDGRPIICGGVVPTDRHWVWLRISEGTGVVTILRILKEALSITMDAFGDPELFSLVLDGFDSGERLASHFGFLKTGETMEDNVRTFNVWRRP